MGFMSTADCIREQVELAATASTSPRVLPRLFGLAWLISRGTELPWEDDDMTPLLETFELANRTEVLVNALSTSLPLYDIDLTMPKKNIDVERLEDLGSDMDWFAELDDEETVGDWLLYAFGYPGGREDTLRKFSVTVKDYDGELFAYADSDAFAEEIWFIALTTADGTPVGWDSGGGVDW